MPLIILGGIYGGVFTPTEAAAMAAIYSIPIGLWVYKACTFKGFLAMTKEATSTVGSIMVMIVCCLMLSRVFTVYRVPELVLELLMSITTNKYILLFIIDIFLFIVGMIVNDTTGVLICAPLLMPVMNQLGISPIHFASIMGVNLAMGGVTPPYASILYLGMRIGKAEFHEILKPTMTFLILGYVPIVFLVTYWPDLALAIPRMAGFAV
jgi:C4-dicarboxylate transporter DctM subunit